MSIDFKANQIRTSQIIATGSSLSPSLVIYGKDAATNFIGGTTFPGAVFGSDTFLYVSGAIGRRGITSSNGVAVFGGDLVSSGTIASRIGLSGSLTKLWDGSSYLIAGANVTITTGSTGAVTISSTGGTGSPGGSTTQVQFNDSSAFQGSPGLTYSKVTETLSAGSLNVTGSKLTVTGTVDIRVPEVPLAFNIRSDGAPETPLFTIDADGLGIGFNGIPTESYEFNKLRGGDLDKILFLSGGSPSSSDIRKTADVNFFVSGSISGKNTSGTSLFGGDLVTSGTLYALNGRAEVIAGSNSSILSVTSNSKTAQLLQTTAGEFYVKNATFGGNFIAQALTSEGVANNFIELRPNGSLTGSTISIFPSSVYAGASNPFNSPDTNFFVAGGRNKKGGTTGGTSVFGGDLVISGSTYLGTDNTDRVNFNAKVSSDIIPDGNRTRNLGSDTARFANVYTGDLHLKNERGDYTLIEEEDCLTIRFNKTGKRYRFLLEPAPEFDEK